MKVLVLTEACFVPATATITVTAPRSQTSLLLYEKEVVEVIVVVIRMKSKRICDPICERIYNNERLA